MNEELSPKKYSAIRQKKLSWLWYPYIAYGKITLLQGDPGDGKSTFMIELAALLSTGRTLPDGTKGKKPINIIYQCSEDNPEDTIKPRLQKAKADCDKIYFFSNGDNLTLDDKRLEKAIMDLDAKLVIFDPIQSFIPAGTDMLNAVKMRTVMNSLSRVAERCKCAVVLIGHLTKDSSGKSLYRMLGSIDIVALARSALMITRDEDDPDVRIVTQIKNNLAPQGVDIHFAISEESGFQWLSGEKKKNSVPSVLGHAKVAILAMLHEGNMKASEAMDELKNMGISERTARKALKELKIESKKIGNAWYWHLPDVAEGSRKEE